MTRAVSAVGWIKSAIGVLTESTQAVHEPPADLSEAHCVILPSLEKQRSDEAYNPDKQPDNVVKTPAPQALQV